MSTCSHERFTLTPEMEAKLNGMMLIAIDNKWLTLHQSLVSTYETLDAMLIAFTMAFPEVVEENIFEVKLAMVEHISQIMRQYHQHATMH